MTVTAPAAYTIRVGGHLDDHWSGWFGGLTITRHGDGTSTLTGPFADQAQLHGALAGLRDIGATLLELRPTAPAGPPSPGPGRLTLRARQVRRRLASRRRR